MRSRTVLSLVQLSNSIGSRRLAKAISQEQIKRSAWSLSHVAGGGLILGFCELRVIGLLENIYLAAPSKQLHVPRGILDPSAILSPRLHGLSLPCKSNLSMCFIDLNTRHCCIRISIVPSRYTDDQTKRKRLVRDKL